MIFMILKYAIFSIGGFFGLCVFAGAAMAFHHDVWLYLPKMEEFQKLPFGHRYR